MGAINADLINALGIQFSGIFYNALAMALANSPFDLVAETVPSGTSENEYAWEDAAPDLELEEGEKKVWDTKVQRYAIKNLPYSNFIRVKRDDLADDNIGIYRAKFRAAGAKAGQWLGKNVLKLLPLGITSGGLCFDGQPYFSASHPDGQGGTYSNYNSNGDSGDPWYLIDGSQALKPLIHQDREGLQFYPKNRPTDDSVYWDEDVIWKWRRRSGFGYTLPQFAYCSRATLDEANFEAAIEAMAQMADSQGDELDIQPTLLVVGPKNQHKAKKIVQVDKLASGASNIHYQSVSVLQSRFVETIPS